MFWEGAAYVYESPSGDACLVLNIHNPFMHCATSQYVFITAWHHNAEQSYQRSNNNVRAITFTTASPCRIPLNGMFHQDSATKWNQLQIQKKCCCLKFVRKRHLNSVWTQYVCDKSAKARMCAKWQWSALDWCYWIALPASPVVWSSNTVSCGSLSFCTHPWILAIRSPGHISYLGTVDHLNCFDCYSRSKAKCEVHTFVKLGKKWSRYEINNQTEIFNIDSNSES